MADAEHLYAGHHFKLSEAEKLSKVSDIDVNGMKFCKEV